MRTKGYFKLSTADKPLITVVTVVFNGEKLLEETILSVINQAYDNVEYIIIDGGSTDGTLDIIKKYEHAIDYWVSERDKGIYDAMNKGIDLSLGSGIVFMNAGDYFVGEVLNFIKNIPCLLRVKCKNFLGLVKELMFKNPKQGMPYCHQGIVFDNKIKMHYDLSYSISSDYDFLIKKGVEKQPILNSTGYVYYDDNGISSKNIILRDKESSKIIMNNFGFFYYCLFIVKSWVKVKIKKLLRVIV
ncbi:MAG: glycosyltransferase [Epsilonproteobacteria bacterium]|nr:glycosyltransferase [Campylobacterota bacterium]